MSPISFRAQTIAQAAYAGGRAGALAQVAALRGLDEGLAALLVAQAVWWARHGAHLAAWVLDDDAQEAV